MITHARNRCDLLDIVGGEREMPESGSCVNIFQLFVFAQEVDRGRLTRTRSVSLIGPYPFQRLGASWQTI